LSDQITVLFSDYRDLTGEYDKLVSLEMIEAVGHQYFDSYFGKCSVLLELDGMMLLQAITIADQRYEAAKRSVDFNRAVFGKQKRLGRGLQSPSCQTGSPNIT